MGVILTPGDGVQKSVSSIGTTFVKQSLSEMVIFPIKTGPVLHLWWWILGGLGVILTNMCHMSGTTTIKFLVKF